MRQALTNEEKAALKIIDGRDDTDMIPIGVHQSPLAEELIRLTPGGADITPVGEQLAAELFGPRFGKF